METLYVYEHCPFCVKARMIFGLKNRPVELKFLLNDDEKTPIEMIGKKMLPVLRDGDGYRGESMDIVHKIDNADGAPAVTGQNNPAISAWVESVCYTYGLVVPRSVLAGLPEFATEQAKNYYLATKKRTNFYWNVAELMPKTDEFLAKINLDLLKLAPLIQSKNACNGTLSEDDFLLFSLLRGLSLVKGVVYPKKVDEYRKHMSLASNVPLFHEDL